MIKSYYLLLLLKLSTIFSFGQQITFEKNISYASQKLNFIQKLNKTGDSLILETDSEKIKQVDILNDDYLETINLDSTKGKINLKNLAIGNYVIQARIGKHWIVMYMEKTENIETNPKQILAIKDEDPDVTIPLPKLNSDETIFKNNILYWVVYETNSSFSSGKIMSFKNVNEVQVLINKIELELKSDIGKYNKLSVYEIYDKPNFIRKQFNNQTYYKSKESELFNVLPIFNSDDLKLN